MEQALLQIKQTDLTLKKIKSNIVWSELEVVLVKFSSEGKNYVIYHLTEPAELKPALKSDEYYVNFSLSTA